MAALPLLHLLSAHSSASSLLPLRGGRRHAGMYASCYCHWVNWVKPHLVSPSVGLSIGQSGTHSLVEEVV